MQLAMKTNQAGVIYFADNVPLLALLDEGGTIEGQAFLSAWKALPPESQSKLSVAVSSVEAAKQKLQAANMFVLAHRPVSVRERGWRRLQFMGRQAPTPAQLMG